MLPNDISQCVGFGCDIRDQCQCNRQIDLDKRNANHVNNRISTVSTFREGHGPCEAFIKIED